MTVEATLPGKPLANLRMIAPEHLTPHPGNVREDLGDLDELVASIQQLGVLQPLIVAYDGTTRPPTMTVIAGHRRLEASKRAGLTRVPVVLRTDLTGADIYQAMLIENLHRATLAPLEEARALAGLVESGMGQREIARRIGKSQSYVARRLLLNDLPPEVQGRLTAKELSPKQAVDIARQLAGRRPDEVDRGWSKPWLSEAHPLADTAREMCAAAGHGLRRRIGQVACGECWEHVIRQDERQRRTDA